MAPMRPVERRMKQRRWADSFLKTPSNVPTGTKRQPGATTHEWTPELRRDIENRYGPNVSPLVRGYGPTYYQTLGSGTARVAGTEEGHHESVRAMLHAASVGDTLAVQQNARRARETAVRAARTGMAVSPHGALWGISPGEVRDYKAKLPMLRSFEKNPQLAVNLVGDLRQGASGGRTRVVEEFVPRPQRKTGGSGGR